MKELVDHPQLIPANYDHTSWLESFPSVMIIIWGFQGFLIWQIIFDQFLILLSWFINDFLQEQSKQKSLIHFRSMFHLWINQVVGFY